MNENKIKIKTGNVQNSRASNITTLILDPLVAKSSFSNIFDKCHAALTPVIPLPMMQTSASFVSGPILPSSARGFAPGVSSQNDLVGLSTGNDILYREFVMEVFEKTSPSNTCCPWAAHWTKLVDRSDKKKKGSPSSESEFRTCRKNISPARTKSELYIR